MTNSIALSNRQTRRPHPSGTGAPPLPGPEAECPVTVGYHRGDPVRRCLTRNRNDHRRRRRETERCARHRPRAGGTQEGRGPPGRQRLCGHLGAGAPGALRRAGRLRAAMERALGDRPAAHDPRALAAQDPALHRQAVPGGQATDQRCRDRADRLRHGRRTGRGEHLPPDLRARPLPQTGPTAVGLQPDRRGHPRGLSPLAPRQRLRRPGSGGAGDGPRPTGWWG